MTTQLKNTVKKYLTLENVKDSASLINTVALSSTEKAFNKGFDVAETLQAKTETLVKKGLALSAKNQDLVFDTLESSKEKTVKFVKKATKRFKK